MASPVTITSESLKTFFARNCPGHSIHLAGAVPLPTPLPHQAAWLEWIASGRHADLAYLARDPHARLDPTLANPWAQSLLVFAQKYTEGWEPDDSSASAGTAVGRPWTDGVARYARGLDYHDIFLNDIAAVLAELGQEVPDLRAHPAVDTGPYLEREYAWLAGLGFFGKNTCLIHERLGSGLFLAVALTNLQILGLMPAREPATEPLWAVVPRNPSARSGDEATPTPSSVRFRDLVRLRQATISPGVSSRCGHCRLCLDACPTGALDTPFSLDARLCISTWTIELRGMAPPDRRDQQRGLLFGCDICQAVCPWNHKAARRKLPACRPPEYAVLPEHEEVDLQDLLKIDATEFRRRFRRTPLWRSHPEGLQRNALVVAANTGRGELVDEIQDLALNDPDSEVRTVANWAADQFQEGQS